MIHKKAFSVLGGFLLFTAGTAFSQDIESLLPGLKDKAVVLDITARILENNSEEVWNSKSSKVTIPGKAVSIKFIGSNIVVVVQFTPYIRRDGRTVLVAQGQIWVDIPQQGMRYQTIMQTIPITFGEEVYFLPLGSSNSDGSVIEILLRLHPYREEITQEYDGKPEESSSDTEALRSDEN
ncbi:MAG: hypothetical protein LBH75_06630 [Treponema sp.]|jgi:hypothetical protein|nr:hypothetical protein [Treponema sp.]